MAAKKNGGGQESDMQMKISSLISQIRCGDARKCVEDARTQLLAIGSPAVPALLEAVRVEKGVSRLEMAKLLRLLADTSSAGALVELLSDDDFDVRWEAIEGLSALGYDGLEPLISAIIQTPGSMKLRNGSHHILHHIASKGYYTLLKPLMTALEGAIPNVEVPAAARKVKSELAHA
jgi:HEAT repeat protein